MTQTNGAGLEIVLRNPEPQRDVRLCNAVAKICWRAALNALALASLLISTNLVAADKSSGPSLHTGIWRGHPVTYIVQGGRAIFEGDILLEHVDANPTASPHPSNRSSGPIPHSLGLAYSAFLWPKDTNTGVVEIPYQIDALSDPNATPKIQQAISSFNSKFSGLIQWVSFTNQTDWVDFNLNAGDLSGYCASAMPTRASRP